jgi:Fe-S cluster biosynthesis and repair protein YggX
MNDMDGNPSEKGMYRSVRLDQRKSSHAFVITLVVSFACVGWLWFFFGSGFWNVSDIEMQGLKMLDRGEVSAEAFKIIDERAWRPWNKRNLLLLDTERLAAMLKERLFVEDITVDKSYPSILRLNIKERQRSVILLSNDQYVNVDATGIVTGDAEGDVLRASQDRVAARAFADEIHLPIVVMNTADPLAPGFHVASAEQVQRWIEVSRALVVGGLKIRFMKVETPEASLGRFVGERGYDIYVDLERPVDAQIATYQAYMRTKPDESLIKEHLDIRIPGQVIIK